MYVVVVRSTGEYNAGNPGGGAKNGYFWPFGAIFGQKYIVIRSPQLILRISSAYSAISSAYSAISSAYGAISSAYGAISSAYGAISSAYSAIFRKVQFGNLRLNLDECKTLKYRKILMCLLHVLEHFKHF